MSQKEVFDGLQLFITDLAQQSDGHQIESRLLKSQGYGKLTAKYAEQAKKEREYVDQVTDRMIELGGDVKLEVKKVGFVSKNPIECIKSDLQLAKEVHAWLGGFIEEIRTDYTTFDILKKYYRYQEEEMYWSEAQLELIEKIGEKNWILLQI
ncbi:MAG: hypothetical protein K6G51_07770 [Sphaerochaetaceae bacterium]|nr:hypothetical protein [Sphaerochaetaceae bacterium]